MADRLTCWLTRGSLHIQSGPLALGDARLLAHWLALLLGRQVDLDLDGLSLLSNALGLAGWLALGLTIWSLSSWSRGRSSLAASRLALGIAHGAAVLLGELLDALGIARLLAHRNTLGNGEVDKNVR